MIPILLQADNVGDHTTYNWFHSSRAEYRALTTRFLVCSWTAYAFPHHCLFFNAMFNQFSLERGFIFHLVLAWDSPSKEPKLIIKCNHSISIFLFWEYEWMFVIRLRFKKKLQTGKKFMRRVLKICNLSLSKLLDWRY